MVGSTRSAAASSCSTSAFARSYSASLNAAADMPPCTGPPRVVPTAVTCASRHRSSRVVSGSRLSFRFSHSITVVACSPAKSRARNDPIAPSAPGSFPRRTFSSGVKANRSGMYSASPCTTAWPAATPGATPASRCSAYSPDPSRAAMDVKPTPSAFPTASASGTPAFVSALATPAPVTISGTAASSDAPPVETPC